jgi:acyl-CoA dehydrogenase
MAPFPDQSLPSMSLALGLAYLPFLEARHKELALALDAWAQANIDDAPHGRGAETDAACVNLVRTAGRRRLDPVTPLAAQAWGGSADAIDTRGICLIRETLARHSRPGRFRLRHAGPGQRRDHPGRHDGSRSASYLPRVASRGTADGRLRPVRGRRPAPTSAPCAAPRIADGDSYVLNGEKTWISNGGIADFYVVFARTGEAPGVARHQRFHRRCRHAGPGDRRAHRSHRPASAGAPALQPAAAFPPRQRLGEAGQGFKLAMRTLDIFRTSVAAAALGFARRALDEALCRATARQDVRPDAGRLPADPGQAGGDGGGHRCCRAAGVSRGMAARPGPRTSRARRRWPRWSPPNRRSR